MTILEALLLGLVQGITAFIPVSSSGHLAILESLLQIHGETGLPFAATLHLATLAAVVGAMRRELKKLLLEFCRSLYDIYENIRIYFHNRHEKDARRYKKILSNNYRKMFLLLVIASAPGALEGWLLRDLATLAGGNLMAVGTGLLITGIVLLVADFFPRGKQIPKDIPYSAALVIGMVQGITVIPGLSRLGLSLVLCLAYGFQRKFAVKFAFLLSIPAIIGACIVEYSQPAGISFSWQLAGYYGIGAVTAGIAAYLCIRKMMKVLQNKKFYGFSIYCFLIGAAAVAGSFYLG